MWWLEDSSHRGQDHQAWTVVGCHCNTPIWNKPSIFRQVCQSQPMYRLTEWHDILQLMIQEHAPVYHLVQWWLVYCYHVQQSHQAVLCCDSKSLSPRLTASVFTSTWHQLCIVLLCRALLIWLLSVTPWVNEKQPVTFYTLQCYRLLQDITHYNKR